MCKLRYTVSLKLFNSLNDLFHLGCISFKTTLICGVPDLTEAASATLAQHKELCLIAPKWTSEVAIDSETESELTQLLQAESWSWQLETQSYQQANKDPEQ